MKTINRILSSVLLAAIIAVGSAQVTEMSSIKASAAYTHDLSITGYESFNLTTDEYTDIEYRFSGEGIAAVQLKTSSNFTAYTKDVRWLEYPFTCQAFYSIKNLDGEDGSLQFSLLDDDGQEAMTFTTSVTVNISSNAPVEPMILFENMYFPQSIDEGYGQHISGVVSSNKNIDAVQAVVYNSDSNVVLSAKHYPNATSYSLYDSNIDWSLSFAKLSPGDYTLTYFVASGSADRSYTHNFTVKAKEAAIPIVNFENMNFPSSFKEGTDPVMDGSIRSTQNIDYLSVEVRDSYGNLALSSYNNLAWRYITLRNSGVNVEIDFSKLDTGDYTINYYASSGLGSNTYTQYFTVYPAYKPDPVITFSDMLFPFSINEGNGQHISGTIDSTENIDAVQAVVTDSSGNVWLNAKRYPGQNEYELFNSPLDWDLSFSKLPTGEYTLTYFVASGTTDRSYSHSFTVRENAESGAIILFHDIEFPENIAVGKGEHIKGKITSSGIIKKIQAVITDSSSGKEVNSAVKYPNASTYVLYNSDLDWALPFGELSSGNYTLTYNVTAGSTTESYSCSFSVGKNTDMTLSRENGFSYCAKWWNKRNNSWPNKGSDCSNFAAQFLWASGLQTDSKFTPGSRTVLGFDNLKKYLYETYGVETIMRKRYSDCLAVEKGFAKYKSKLSAKDVSPGDLVVMPGYDSNGNLINDGHIMIVYKVKGSKIYCYGHSNNRNGKKYYVNDSYIQGVVKTSALFE